MNQRPPEPTRAPANDTRPERPPLPRAVPRPADALTGGWRTDELPLAFAGLVTLWQARRHGAAPPRRAEIQPAELPPRLLAYMCVIERVDGPRQRHLRLRLAGTGVERAAGRALTGVWLGEIAPMPAHYADWLDRLLAGAFAQATPIFAEGVFLAGRREPGTLLATRKLVLPLADESGDLRFALTAQTFAQAAARRPLAFLQADSFRPGRSGPVSA